MTHTLQDGAECNDRRLTFSKSSSPTPRKSAPSPRARRSWRRRSREASIGIGVRVAAEYGPGLGSITKALLERLDGQDFFAIEFNEAYADALSKQFPELSVYWDSVANIKKIAAAHGATPIDAVVSSLPWANFSDGVQDELLDATMSVLAPDGQFATFSYVHGLVLKSGLRFREKLERRFRSVERSDVVWRSVPPAVVYHCQR